MDRRSTWVIVVAAGEGRRFGAPKQFVSLGGRPVLEWSVLAARSVACGVVLVVPGDRAGDPDLARLADAVVPGGATRAESVRSGLSAVPEEVEIVIVHDAARPLASPALFAAVLGGLVDGVDGVIPALALSDTVKRVRGGVVTETLDRSELVTVQTPQAFRAAALRGAHRLGGEATDDAALLERAGAAVRIVEGEAENLKLTDASDLTRAAAVLAVRERT